MIKYVGAVYLVYLGIKSGARQIRDSSRESRPLAASGWARYRTGMLVSLSNPKAILFCVAFFPQFIDRRQPLAPQASILLITFAVIETCWMLIYAGGGARLAAWLRTGQPHALVQPRFRRRVHRSRRSARHLQAVTAGIARILSRGDAASRALRWAPAAP